MAMTVVFISEAFVSYAPMPARDIQASLQLRIFGYGATILALQLIALGAMIVAGSKSKS